MAILVSACIQSGYPMRFANRCNAMKRLPLWSSKWNRTAPRTKRASAIAGSRGSARRKAGTRHHGNQYPGWIGKGETRLTTNIVADTNHNVPDKIQSVTS